MKSHKNLFFIVILVLALISALLDCNADIVVYVRDYIVHITGYGIIDDKHYCIGFPFGLNVALSGCLFIYIGNVLSTIINRCEMFKIHSVRIITFVISVIIGIYFYILNDGDNKLIAMSLAKYGNYCYFVTTAFFFSFATVLISMYINNPVFAKYGKYTLAIYGFHLSLTFIPHIICRIINLNIENNAELKGLLFGSIVLIVSCIIIPFIRKVDSNLIGERN